MEQVKEVEAGEDELNAIAISKNVRNLIVRTTQPTAASRGPRLSASFVTPIMIRERTLWLVEKIMRFSFTAGQSVKNRPFSPAVPTASTVSLFLQGE